MKIRSLGSSAWKAGAGYAGLQLLYNFSLKYTEMDSNFRSWALQRVRICWEKNAEIKVLKRLFTPRASVPSLALAQNAATLAPLSSFGVNGYLAPSGTNADVVTGTSERGLAI